MLWNYRACLPRLEKFPSPHHLEKNPARYARSWLVMSVGAEKALEIARELFPLGGQADIPSATARIAADARRKYVEGNAGYYSTREIALYLGMTERGVRMIKSCLRKEGKIE